MGVVAFLRRLRASNRAAVLPMMAVGLVVMVVAIGSAIDTARIYIAVSQLQTGVDAAALAGANAFDNDDDTDPNGRRAQVIAYFRDNFPDTYMGVERIDSRNPISPTHALLEPQFTTINGVSRTVVEATARLPLTFMSLFGLSDYVIQADAYAEFQPHPLEVQVVLDNTGSMADAINGTSKISALKTAMHSFINVLFQGKSGAQPDLALGIINYTNAVNVGSILKEYSIPIEEMSGFTDRSWPGDGMGWKGCVANDDSITNMSSTLTTQDANAFDITNILPGEKLPNGAEMRPIRPLLVPPLWKPKSLSADKTSASSQYYQPADDTSFNNLYGGAVSAPGNSAAVAQIANSATYKRFFYRYYISLNNGAANNADDVIVATDGSSYYDPNAANAYDPLKGTGTDFYVRVDKIPNLPKFRSAATYQVTSNNTAMPSPNWQCPEPGLPLKYNIDRATYDDFIDQKVWAVKPANGTMHHTGFIWGWRILSRYDRFTRAKPVGSGVPERALVFMTDGKNEIGDYSGNNDKVYTGYGSLADQTITTGTNGSAVGNASTLRFKKACALANSYVFPDSKRAARIYVVAINAANAIDSTTQTFLRNCGSGGFWLTTTPSELDLAFSQIARSLIDAHLVK